MLQMMLCKNGCHHAAAGADFVAPDMMDGRFEIAPRT
jgi:delta-aminolevulinic acid dehydratase/porphobilinogen synthase